MLVIRLGVHRKLTQYVILPRDTVLGCAAAMPAGDGAHPGGTIDLAFWAPISWHAAVAEPARGPQRSPRLRPGAKRGMRRPQGPNALACWGGPGAAATGRRARCSTVRWRGACMCIRGPLDRRRVPGSVPRSAPRVGCHHRYCCCCTFQTSCILPSAEVLLGVTSRFRFALHRRSSCRWSWSQRWRSWTVWQVCRASSLDRPAIDAA